MDIMIEVDEFVALSGQPPTAKFVRRLGDEIELLRAEVSKLRLVIVHEADCTEAADDEAMRRGHEIERLKAALALHHAIAEADRKDGDDVMWTAQYAEACDATSDALNQQRMDDKP